MAYIGDGYLNIYSNDGSTSLGYYVMTISESGRNYGIVTDSGATVYAGNTLSSYAYSGNLKFLGFATEPNATEPTYAIGDKFLWAANPNVNYGQDVTNLYIVESLEGTTWYVPSGWSAIHNYGIFSVNYNYEYGTNSGSQSTLRIGYDNGSSDNGDNIIGFGTKAIYPTTAFTLTFTGGTDATNPDLIKWLTTYGIQLKVTDLTDTTWTLKDTECEAGYGIFDVQFRINGGDQVFSGPIKIGYDGIFGGEGEGSFVTPTANSVVFLPLGPYRNNDIKSFTITGGTDIKNPKLIAWLSKWGELRLTDLKGTTWEYTVQSVVPKGTMTHTDGYSVSGTINSTPFSGISSKVVDYSNNLDDGLHFESVTLFPNGVVPFGIVGNVYHIKFTAGDTTNTSLISWMYDNCTLVSINEETKIPTDLTGYTVTVPAGWTATADYGIYQLTGTGGFDSSGYYGDMQGFAIGRSKSWTSYAGLCAITSDFTNPYNTNTTARDNANSFTLTITGGDDADDPNLIQWLVDNNATFEKTGGEEEPDTPSIPTTPHGEIYYKGNLVATIVEGETIVLHTKDFKFLGDIVIKNVKATNLQTITVMTKLWGDTNDQYAPTTITLGAEIKTWQEFIDSSYNSPYLNDYYEFGVSSYAERISDVYLRNRRDLAIENGLMTSGSLFYDEEQTKGILLTDEIIPNGVYYASLSHIGGSN